MRSYSELLFFIFDLKKDGPAYAVRFCKTRRDKIYLKIRGPRRQFLAQNPTTRPIGSSTRKMASVFKHVQI